MPPTEAPPTGPYPVSLNPSTPNYCLAVTVVESGWFRTSVLNPGTVLGQKYPNASANTKIARASTSFSTHHKMPPRRSFGTEISGNARKRPHLTPSQRTVIIAKHEASASLASLASEFGRSKSTIHDTIKRFSLHQTTSDLPRSGRPPRLSSRTKKIYTEKHVLLQRLST
jgi:hypothetical protein